MNKFTKKEIASIILAMGMLVASLPFIFKGNLQSSVITWVLPGALLMLTAFIFYILTVIQEIE